MKTFKWGLVFYSLVIKNVNVCIIVKTAMAGFTKKIVDMMKEEELFETQGGPIILSQVNGLITHLILQCFLYRSFFMSV